MIRLSIGAVAFTVGFSTAGFAQDLTAAQRDACKADYEKYCSGVMPGGGRIIACLNKQHTALSDACKKVVDAKTK
jgi:cysteine rich repeat protein